MLSDELVQQRAVIDIDECIEKELRVKVSEYLDNIARPFLRDDNESYMLFANMLGARYLRYSYDSPHSNFRFTAYRRPLENAKIYTLSEAYDIICAEENMTGDSAKKLLLSLLMG